MKFFTFFIVLLITPIAIFAQLQANDSIQKTPSLYNAFRQGNWELNSRTVFMSTLYHNTDLRNDYAVGTSINLGLTTKSFYGFQLGISGSFMFNINSSAIDAPDPLTQNPNRYELGLFDLENPSQKSDLNKLEKLFLRYTFSKTSIEFGRIGLASPFINAQDGRLRPTAQQGFWLNMKEVKNLSISGGWINAISPRSIIKWHTVGETIGLYPSGVMADGTKSNYKNNVETEGIALTNIIYQPTKNLRFNVWNTYVENVLNTVMIEVNHELPLKKNKQIFYQSLMLVHEDAVNDGGDEDEKKAYIQKGTKANVISAQIGIKSTRLNTSINYTRITAAGRFLMPREWGRDPFYTFMPRERNEGFGDVHAFVVRSNYTSKSKQLKAGLAYGYYDLPDVKNYALNKYSQPSYHQINIDGGYVFAKALKGFELRALVAWKLNAGNLYDSPKFEYNRVNMANCNLILEYKL